MATCVRAEKAYADLPRLSLEVSVLQVLLAMHDLKQASCPAHLSFSAALEGTIFRVTTLDLIAISADLKAMEMHHEASMFLTCQYLKDNSPSTCTPGRSSNGLTKYSIRVLAANPCSKNCRNQGRTTSVRGT